MFFDHKSTHAAAQPDLANLKITDARLGDTLSVSGAAEDFSDVDFSIDRVDGYQAASRSWHELSGMWRDRRVYLEVHRDEVVQVFGNFDGRRLTLDELGLSEDDLSQMDQRQNPADFFDYNGKFWLYRFSREMGVFSPGAQTGRGFYCWQFQEQDGQRFLSIRKLQGEPFVAAIWTKLEPADITVYRSG
jgi:hypothetical protein